MSSHSSSEVQPRFSNAFLRALVRLGLMKKVMNVSVGVLWVGDVGTVRWICFLTVFGAPEPSTGWGLSSSKLSSEEYSITILLSALPLAWGLPSGSLLFPFPLLMAFLHWFSWLFVWCEPYKRPHLMICMVLGLCQGRECLYFI